jgi:hypothetical protein
MLFRAVRENPFEQVVILVHGGAVLAAGAALGSADSAASADYTRKNEVPARQ